MSYSKIQPNSTPTLDYLRPLGSPRSLNFGPIIDYLVHQLQSHLRLLRPLGHLDYMYDLIWTIPFRLDHLVTSVIYLSPLVLGLPLDSSVYTTQTFGYYPPFIYPGSCTSLQFRLVPFLSMLLLAFGHCLVTTLYKPIHCSCSSPVQISHHVVLSHPLITTSLTLYPCPQIPLVLSTPSLNLLIHSPVNLGLRTLNGTILTIVL